MFILAKHVPVVLCKLSSASCKLSCASCPVQVVRQFQYHLQGPYSPTILENILVLQNFLYLAEFECNTTSDWLIRSCVTFKFANLGEKGQITFLRMFGEYGPSSPLVKLSWLGLCVRFNYTIYLSEFIVYKNYISNVTVIKYQT